MLLMSNSNTLVQGHSIFTKMALDVEELDSPQLAYLLTCMYLLNKTPKELPPAEQTKQRRRRSRQKASSVFLRTVGIAILQKEKRERYISGVYVPRIYRHAK